MSCLNKEYIPEPTYKISFLYRKILVPIDGSENSLRALDFALDLARRYGSRITVVYVSFMGSSKTKEDPLKKAEERVKNAGIHTEYKLIEVNPSESSISKAILDEVINGGYDMVVMGARGKTVSEDLNLGSVALAVTINASSTVVIVR